MGRRMSTMMLKQFLRGRQALAIIFSFLFMTIVPTPTSHIFYSTKQLLSTLGIICTTEEIYSTVCWKYAKKNEQTNNECRNRWHEMKMRHARDMMHRTKRRKITALLDLTSFDSRIRDERRYYYNRHQ
jgi:hypothetical protein